ncbi:MAG: glycine betaine transport system permease protein [Chloroflexi bacterium]|jgi:osmoprotectant transport system permease protein|nr:glycine betaine transport system permease protein [Chloroflexota bacterium]MEA2617152.1 osmoprotectant transport system permease protein [Chloroflexota bacterium]
MRRRRPGGLRLALTPALVGVALLLLYLWVHTADVPPEEAAVLSPDFIGTRLTQHVELTITSFLIAAALALPLGVAAARAGRAVRLPVLLAANLGQAIPSIALLALVFTVTGFTFRTTVIALVVYAILPILRNTMAGLQGVDPDAVEAARGMGMSPAQVLLRVELPLASPVVFAGLRTALVLVVGTATLGNFVGGGGLGDVIESGLTAAGLEPASRIVVVGAVLVAALALLADWLLSLVERAVVPTWEDG